MVKSSGNRVIYFLFGITVGLLVGAGFFIFKIDEYISRIELFNKQGSDTLLTEQVQEEEQVSNTGKKISTTVVPSHPDTGSTHSGIQQTDSFFADSLYRVSTSEDETFEVKKDELITTKEISVGGKSSVSSTPKDSALKNISGIRDDKDAGGSMTVEFWVSPINYRGYKMSKGKIVLFGMSANVDLQLLRTPAGTFMKHGEAYYRLENTSDFRPLEKTAAPEGDN